MNRPLSWVCLVMAICVTTLFMPNASAQQLEDRYSTTDYMISTSTTGLTAAAWITAVIYGNNQDEEIEDLQRKINLYKKLAKIEHYLQDNDYALAESVIIGHGAALQDIATILHIPKKDYKVWSRNMRRQHKVIASALTESNNKSKALKIYTVMMSVHDSITTQVASATMLKTGGVK